MKRSLLVLALAIPFFSGCMATAMKTGEGTIRSFAGNGGTLHYVADVYKGVRSSVLGDTSLVPNDPAANPAPATETLVPAPAAAALVPAAPPSKKPPVAKKEGAKKS